VDLWHLSNENGKKNPELYKKIGNAQKLRKKAKGICDDASNDTATIGRLTAATLLTEFFANKKDFEKYKINLDFHQFVTLLTSEVQKKLNRTNDEDFMSIDIIYFQKPQHRELIKDLFPEFLVNGELVPARPVSMEVMHKFFAWSTKHNVKAYKGMPYLAAFLSSLN
jgi:hypothetical protein